MAEPQTPLDKAAAAQGAGEADLDPATSGNGSPAPAEPPKTKAEADGEDPPKTGEDAPNTGEGEGEPDPTDDTEDTEDTEEKDKPLDTDVWGSTGDEVGDSVLTLLQNGGVTTEEAKSLMYDAVQGGDVTKIDREALEAKVGKERATLILAGAENFISRSKAKAEAIVKEVHTTVGGEDNWNAVTTWAKDNVPAEDLSEYRELIDAGGIKARFAAQELVSRYNGDSKNTTLTTSDEQEIVGDGKANTGGDVLTKAEYVSKMEAAHDRGASPAEIQAIKAARARGRAKGI